MKERRHKSAGHSIATCSAAHHQTARGKCIKEPPGMIPRGTASSSIVSIGSYERTELREERPRVRSRRRRGRQTRNWKAKPSSGLSSSTVNKFSSRISRAVSGAAVGCDERARSKYTLARGTSRRKWLFTALEHTLARSLRRRAMASGPEARHVNCGYCVRSQCTSEHCTPADQLDSFSFVYCLINVPFK